MERWKPVAYRLCVSFIVGIFASLCCSMWSGTNRAAQRTGAWITTVVLQPPEAPEEEPEPQVEGQLDHEYVVAYDNWSAAQTVYIHAYGIYRIRSRSFAVQAERAMLLGFGGVIGSLTALVTFVMLYFMRRGVPDGLTRCEQCGYILRGLSEPRCPECGKPI